MKKLTDLFNIKTTQDISQVPDVESSSIPVTSGIVYEDYMINDSQLIGFEDKIQEEFIYKLATFGLVNENTSVLDVSAKRGDFISYLKKIYAVKKVNGFEPNKFFFDISKHKYPEHSIENIDILDKSLQDFSLYKSDIVFNILGLRKSLNFKQLPIEVILNTVIYKMLELKNQYAVLILFNSELDNTDFYSIHPSTLIPILDQLNCKYAIDYLDSEYIYKIILK